MFRLLRLENIMFGLAKLVPPRLRYFVTVMSIAEATTGKWERTHVCSLKAMEVLDRIKGSEWGGCESRTIEGRKEIRWFRNGDHPQDQRDRTFIDSEGKSQMCEGLAVRYYRHPFVSGDIVCNTCAVPMHDHGWIDSGGDGVTVCPGDFVPCDLAIPGRSWNYQGAELSGC